MVAGLAAARGQAAVAVRLVAAAQALRGELGAQPQAHEQATYEATLATARAALEPAAYTAAWEAGPALTLEQAMGEAAQVAAAPPVVPAAPSLTER